MCPFVAYKGQDIFRPDLLTRSSQSLIHQSFEARERIEGTTDSEHAFAAFLQQLKRHRSNYDVNTLAKIMRKTISKLNHWSSTPESAVAHCNFAVTDGHSIVASRYVSGQREEPQTLYVASGDQFKVSDGRNRMAQVGNRPKAVIIASEPLTDVVEDWELVPRNHLVTVSPELHIQDRPR